MLQKFPHWKRKLTKSSILPKLDYVFLRLKGEHRISSGMQMSTNPNHYPVFPHSFCNQHVVSFQTSTIANGSGAIPVCPASSGGMNSDMTLLNTTPSTIVSTSSPNMLADSNQSLKYAAPMAVDWSYLELQLLNDGLLKYAKLPLVLKELLSHFKNEITKYLCHILFRIMSICLVHVSIVIS